jgi:ABC-2 type transport system ATP-binding protein
VGPDADARARRTGPHDLPVLAPDERDGAHRDHILVLGRGRIFADAGVADIIARSSGTTVLVRSPQAAHLVELLRGPDVPCTAVEPGAVEVAGTTAQVIGEAAAAASIILHELTPCAGTLEDSYLSLTADAVEYHSSPVPPPKAPAALPEEQLR